MSPKKEQIMYRFAIGEDADHVSTAFITCDAISPDDVAYTKKPVWDYKSPIDGEITTLEVANILYVTLMKKGRFLGTIFNVMGFDVNERRVKEI